MYSPKFFLGKLPSFTLGSLLFLANDVFAEESTSSTNITAISAAGVFALTVCCLGCYDYFKKRPPHHTMDPLPLEARVEDGARLV